MGWRTRRGGVEDEVEEWRTREGGRTRERGGGQGREVEEEGER